MASAMAPPVPPVKVRPRPVVPDYLRDPPKKSRLLPAAAVMLFVGAAIGLLLVMVANSILNARQQFAMGQAKLTANRPTTKNATTRRQGPRQSTRRTA